MELTARIDLVVVSRCATMSYMDVIVSFSTTTMINSKAMLDRQLLHADTFQEERSCLF